MVYADSYKTSGNGFAGYAEFPLKFGDKGDRDEFGTILKDMANWLKTDSAK